MTPQPPRRLRYVVLDMDGVLADTEPLFERATRNYANSIDRPVDESFHATTLGRRTSDVITELATLLGRPEPEVAAGRQRALDRLLANGLAPLPGVVESIERLRRADLRLAIATSSARAFALSVIDRLGIAPHIDVLAAGDEVPAGKPAPDVYTLAISRLQERPPGGVAIEDAPAGTTAARAAGLSVIAVTNHRPAPPGLDADLVVNDMTAATEAILQSAR